MWIVLRYGITKHTRITDKSDDVYHDYLNIMVGYSFDATKIQWRLDSATTFEEYETWESYMVQGFARSHNLDSTFGHMEYVIAYRRVDTNVASWWHNDKSAKGITCQTFSWWISSNFCVLDFW
jgi:hypothetical protein